jgi:uncharacterized protein (DUF1778 family)
VCTVGTWCNGGPSEHGKLEEMEREKRVCVRLSAEEEAILKEAAWRRRLTLSEWMRQVMLREARREPRTSQS